MRPLLNSVNNYVYVVDKQKDDYEESKELTDSIFNVDASFCVKEDDEQPKDTTPSLTKGLQREIVSTSDRCYFSALSTVSQECKDRVKATVDQLLLYHDPQTDKNQIGMWKLLRRSFEKLATSDGLANWNKFKGGANAVVTDGARLLNVSWKKRLGLMKRQFLHKDSERQLADDTNA